MMGLFMSGFKFILMMIIIIVGEAPLKSIYPK